VQILETRFWEKLVEGSFWENLENKLKRRGPKKERNYRFFNRKSGKNRYNKTEHIQIIDFSTDRQNNKVSQPTTTANRRHMEHNVTKETHITNTTTLIGSINKAAVEL
jgi:hypothetical protein